MYLKRSARNGLTLIEVIASIALLSTLLVGVLLAHSRHVELIERDQMRLSAIDAAESLLQQWMRAGVLVPRNQQGDFTREEYDGLHWRTSVKSKRYVRRLGIEIVRIEVLTNSEVDSGEPVFRLDVAVPSSGGPNTPASGGTI